jgi:two-component system, LytTR family, response regulator
MIDRALEDIRVLVVDDEPPARQRLIDLLREDGHVTAVLEASNGLAAVAMIERERSDLVFLDVQMPELDGLGVVDAVGPEKMPLTVFVTAYDQHAIRALVSRSSNDWDSRCKRAGRLWHVVRWPPFSQSCLSCGRGHPSS